jgi:hypothetical protein
LSGIKFLYVCFERKWSSFTQAMDKKIHNEL